MAFFLRRRMRQPKSPSPNRSQHLGTVKKNNSPSPEAQHLAPQNPTQPATGKPPERQRGMVRAPRAKAPRPGSVLAAPPLTARLRELERHFSREWKTTQKKETSTLTHQRLDLYSRKRLRQSRRTLQRTNHVSKNVLSLR